VPAQSLNANLVYVLEFTYLTNCSIKLRLVKPNAAKLAQDVGSFPDSKGVPGDSVSLLSWNYLVPFPHQAQKFTIFYFLKRNFVQFLLMKSLQIWFCLQINSYFGTYGSGLWNKLPLWEYGEKIQISILVKQILSSQVKEISLLVFRFSFASNSNGYGLLIDGQTHRHFFLIVSLT